MVFLLHISMDRTLLVSVLLNWKTASSAAFYPGTIGRSQDLFQVLGFKLFELNGI